MQHCYRCLLLVFLSLQDSQKETMQATSPLPSLNCFGLFSRKLIKNRDNVPETVFCQYFTVKDRKRMKQPFLEVGRAMLLKVWFL